MKEEESGYGDRPHRISCISKCFVNYQVFKKNINNEYLLLDILEAVIKQAEKLKMLESKVIIVGIISLRGLWDGIMGRKEGGREVNAAQQACEVLPMSAPHWRLQMFIS